MLSVSNEFKTEIKKLEVYSDGKVSITNTSGTLNFTRDNIVKIDVFGSAFSNDKVLGNLAQHSLTLELLGDLTSSISLNKENIVKVDIGVLVNGVYEYVRFQDFLVTSVIYSDTSNVTQIVATDSIVKLNTEYVDTNTYPITLKNYLIDVLAQCGLELENTNFLNDDFVITSRPYNDGSSCKDIVSRISELALCFAQINKVSNKLELVNAFSPFMRGYTHEELSAFTHEELALMTHQELMTAIGLFDEELSKDNYWNFKLSDHWFGKYGINTLTLKISQVEGENNTKQLDNYVVVDGNKSITISDNPFINTEALRLSVIDGMFDVVKLYKYYPYTLEYRGFPYLELGDSVQITNMNDNLFNSPIYEMTIRYDGGLYGKINASALSQVQTKYLNTQTLTQRVKSAELIVDKINGEVSILAGDYYDGKLVGAKYVFDGDNATFYGGGLIIKDDEDNTVLTANIDGELILSGLLGTVDNLGNIRTSLSNGGLSFYSGLDKGYESRIEPLVDEGSSSLNIYTGTTSDIPNSNRIDIISSNVSLVGSYASGTIILDNYIETGFGIVLRSDFSDSSIPTTTYSLIELDSAIRFKNLDEDYFLFIGGQYRLITRDANGFLKC